MLNRPWIIAALVSSSALLLVGPAAQVPMASANLASSHARVSSQTGTFIQVAGEPSTTGSGNWSDRQQPPNRPAVAPEVVIDSHDVRGVLGSAVRSAADEDMGRVVDVIVDRGGIPRAAIIDFGGFLGVGSRKIAIDWYSMRFGGDNRVTLDMTRDQVKAAPQYQPGKPIVILGATAEFAHSQVTESIPER